MTGAVVVAPRRVVMIVPLFREDCLEELAKVPDEPWFELHRRYPRSRTRNKGQHMPFPQPAPLNRLAKGRSQIMDIAVALRRNRHLGRSNHGGGLRELVLFLTIRHPPFPGHVVAGPG